MGVGGEGRRRMKADTEQYQLRTTAAGEPDRAQRERKKTMLEEGKDRANPHWRHGGVGNKTGDKQTRSDRMAWRWEAKVSIHLECWRCMEEKTRGEGKKNSARVVGIVK